jgi:hypothetical protein
MSVALGLILGPTSTPSWEADLSYPVAEGEPKILARWCPFGHESVPLEQNITSLVFETKSVSILRMTPLHGAYRYLRPPEGAVQRSENFSVFVVHKESIIVGYDNRSSEFVYCYCLRGKEFRPYDGARGVAVPVVYCLVSEDYAFDKYFALLHAIGRSRRDWLRLVWTGEARGDWRWPVEVTEAGIVAEDKLATRWEYHQVWLCLFLVKWVRRDQILVLLAALLMDWKIIFVSKSLARRSTAVLALVGFLTGLSVKYPHPVLPSPPFQLLRDLPNAPTPLVAGSYILPSPGASGLVVMNLDTGELSGETGVALEGESGSEEQVNLEWMKRQLEIMNIPDLNINSAKPLLREIGVIRNILRHHILCAKENDDPVGNSVTISLRKSLIFQMNRGTSIQSEYSHS